MGRPVAATLDARAGACGNARALRLCHQAVSRHPLPWPRRPGSFGGHLRPVVGVALSKSRCPPQESEPAMSDDPETDLGEALVRWLARGPTDLRLPCPACGQTQAIRLVPWPKSRRPLTCCHCGQLL